MALAAATVMATAGNASAEQAPGGIAWDHTYKGNGVVVYVEERGDIISVCDTSANGHSAVVYVDEQIPASFGGDFYHLTVTSGSGSCKTARASDGAAHNWGEGSNINVYYDGNGGAWDGNKWFLNDH
ncbi:hypothetical protein ACTIVE_5341 [Actinomadura verrucosospora]|uniref:Uncharacterized protein n=2 Tax=Actinomadura verrucosospora TaxID=46165 RepID=A0A7D3VVB6_ACTVE|nr:hypothetical protein ACTIVE_5341 [Actinomadura verrucosospora]